MNKLKIMYLLPPIVLIIFLLPIEIGAIRYIPRMILGGDFSWFFFILPIYLGFLAFPAYFYVVVRDVKKKSVKSLVCWWIRISFVLAMISCLYGSYVGRILIIPIPLALICFILCVRLLYRFEQE